MKPTTTTTALLLVGCSALATGFHLLNRSGKDQSAPHYNPAPLGPAAQIMQGPLAVGRTLLIPFAYLELKNLLDLGQYGKAKKAARRLLASAPWLKPFWLNLGWSMAYSNRFDQLDPSGKAELLFATDQWLNEAAATLPGDYQIPQTAAFIITDRLPPNSPIEKHWLKLRGLGREEAALAWLEKARARARNHTPLAMRISTVVVSLAARDWAAGKTTACHQKLHRARQVEKSLAGKQSKTGKAWVEELGKLIELTKEPWPGKKDFIARANRLSPGMVFIKSLPQ